MVKKIKVVLASVLKPVDDSRMYEKFACSIAREEQYEVFIIGFRSNREIRNKKIHFLPLFNFRRISIERVFAPWKFYKKLLQLKPEVIIVNTHELLLVSIVYRIIFGSEILYDVQENYFRNILHTSTFPPVIKQLLAFKVRLTEYISRPLISHYFLAERNYEKEFSFSKGKSTVIENKYQEVYIPDNESYLQHKLPEKKKNTIRLLYSGTIARNYGILEAIELTKNISIINPNYELLIIGYCADKTLLTKIKYIINGFHNIMLIGGSELIPHVEIIKAVKTADYGLIAYQPEPSIENCIPTRIYEYLAHRLPMIVQNHEPWVELCSRYKAGIYIDYNSVDIQDLDRRLRNSKYYEKTPGKEVLWDSEASRLTLTLEKITKNISNKD